MKTTLIVVAVLMAVVACDDDSDGSGICGDGDIDPGELCDLLDLGGQTCESLDQGFSGGVLLCDACQFDTSMCTSSCGDGVVDGGEECDGANLDGRSCTSIWAGFTGGELVCSSECSFNDDGCTACGNWVIEAGEQCDGTNLAGDTCTSLGYEGELACSAECLFTGCQGCEFSCDSEDHVCVGQTDEHATCAPACEAGLLCDDPMRTCCYGGCVDLQNDVYNCGSCASYCDGSCINGVCVDACGNMCTTGQECCSGTCSNDPCP